MYVNDLPRAAAWDCRSKEKEWKVKQEWNETGRKWEERGRKERGMGKRGDGREVNGNRGKKAEKKSEVNDPGWEKKQDKRGEKER